MEEEMTSSPFSTTNSTDDPDFKPTEGGGGFSSSSSVSSQFFAKPKKSTDFIMTSFLFVTGDGKYTSRKEHAKSHADQVLVLSSEEVWTQFDSSAPPSSSYIPFNRLGPQDALGSSSSLAVSNLDCLLWVKSEHLEDIALDEWNTMVEHIGSHTFHLSKYMSPVMENVTRTTNCTKAVLGVNNNIGSKVGGLPMDCKVVGRQDIISCHSKDNEDNIIPTKELLGDKIGNKENRTPNQRGGLGSRFNSNYVGKKSAEFSKENTAKNTLRGNTTINLLVQFLRDIHPELTFSKIEDLQKTDLPHLLSEFFMVIQKEDGGEYNAATLETYYQAAGRVLQESHRVDLKNDKDYAEVRKIVSRKQKLSMEAGEVPGKHKSHAISPKILVKCWADGAFGCGNLRALITTVLLHVQSSFGMRGKDELYQMTNSDIVPGSAREDDVPQYLALSERIAKNRRGIKGQDARDINPKMYPDDLRPDRCGVRAHLLYMSKKPDYKLWVGFKNQVRYDWSKVTQWYSSQHMGKDHIVRLISGQIGSTGVNIKAEKISSTSVRKTEINGCMSAGMPGSLTGQKSFTSKLEYMSPDDVTLKASNRLVQNIISGEQRSGPRFAEIMNEEKNREAKVINDIKIKAKMQSRPVVECDEVTIEEVSTDNPLKRRREGLENVGDKEHSKKVKSGWMNKSRRSKKSSSSEEECSKRRSSKAKAKKKKSNKHKKVAASSSSTLTSSASSSSTSSDSSKKKMKKKIKELKKQVKNEKKSISLEVQQQKLPYPALPDPRLYQQVQLTHLGQQPIPHMMSQHLPHLGQHHIMGQLAHLGESSHGFPFLGQSPPSGFPFFGQQPPSPAFPYHGQQPTSPVFPYHGQQSSIQAFHQFGKNVVTYVAASSVNSKGMFVRSEGHSMEIADEIDS